MRISGFIACLVVLLAAAAPAHALGVEAAVGAWQQDPQGDVSYKPLDIDDTLDLERDLRYDDETGVFGRLKIDMPMLVPNIYLMATPMEFEGTGQKNVQFNFGDETFDADVDFFSRVTLDHYDIALYYGLPFLRTATMGALGLELGLNVRVLDIEAVVDQEATGFSDSKSLTLALPMVYVGAQVNPSDWLSLEAEGRGVAYNGDHLLSLMGRVKLRPLGPLFIAAGWRLEDLDVEEDEVKADVEISGPFVEAGLQF